MAAADFECDAYKLIEEFIKKSSPPRPTNTNSAPSVYKQSRDRDYDLPPTLLSLQTPSTRSSDSFSSSYHSSSSFKMPKSITNQFNQNLIRHQKDEEDDEEEEKFNDEIHYDNHMFLVNSTPQSLLKQQEPIINLADRTIETSFVQRPNRPYSYYLATNFNPLDLSQLGTLTVNDTTLTNEILQPPPLSPPKTSTMKQAKSNKKQRHRISTSTSDMLRMSNQQQQQQYVTSTPVILKNQMSTTLRNLKSMSQNYFAAKTRAHSSSNEQENDDDDYNKDHYESISRFQRHSKLSATMPNRLTMPSALKKMNKTLDASSSGRKAPPHHKSLNRINKFFRSLFGKKDDHCLYSSQPPLSRQQGSSKFIRMFSFRNSCSNSSDQLNVKYQYTLATRTTSARLHSTSTTTSSSTATKASSSQGQELVVSDEPAISVNKLPQINLESIHISSDDEVDAQQQNLNSISSPGLSSVQIRREIISFDVLRERFYSEIADRLKRLAQTQTQQQQQQQTTSSAYFSGSTLSNEKSSISSIDSIDIPYIDDDEADAGCCTYEESSNYASSPNSTITNEQLPAAHVVSATTAAAHTELPSAFGSVGDLHKIAEFLRMPNESRFDEIAVFYMAKCEFIWNKIAVLFEMTTRAVQMSSDEAVSERLKQMAACYIHEKYCDWIFEHGGWVSR